LQLLRVLKTIEAITKQLVTFGLVKKEIAIQSLMILQGLTRKELSNAPLSKEKKAQIRADGNPHPGFCIVDCGQISWFSGVSGILIPVPSTTMTRRLFSKSVSGILSHQSAVCLKMSESISSSDFLRAVQYEAVDDEGILIPLMEA
jgi:hypothetical protein